MDGSQVNKSCRYDRRRFLLAFKGLKTARCLPHEVWLGVACRHPHPLPLPRRQGQFLIVLRHARNRGPSSSSSCHPVDATPLLHPTQLPVCGAISSIQIEGGRGGKQATMEIFALLPAAYLNCILGRSSRRAKPREFMQSFIGLRLLDAVAAQKRTTIHAHVISSSTK